MKTAAALFAAALLLAGCGGDDHFSWCYGSEDGNVQAGYNSSCVGGDAGAKDAAAEEAQGADGQQGD